MRLSGGLSPAGEFINGIHKPVYQVINLRINDDIRSLGIFPDGERYINQANFPAADITENNGRWIFEIPNVFPFWGTTYIDKGWADAKVDDDLAFRLPPPEPCSMTGLLAGWLGNNSTCTMDQIVQAFAGLPAPLLLALASTSTDERDLVALARLSCPFEYDPITNRPVGLCYERDARNQARHRVYRSVLFETLANNPYLPDEYKEVMVLTPGAQGSSEIVGEYCSSDGRTHVFEYLRRNSYIPWGHYAANMANTAVRYSIADLSLTDMTGLRHLYYQRIYTCLAAGLDIPLPGCRQSFPVAFLEELRQRIRDLISRPGMAKALPFTATLWGWNFGFDFAPSGYRLHASHQQIHQQYALIPAEVRAFCTGETTESNCIMPAYSFGDQVAKVAREFREKNQQPFFSAYIRAIRNNQRIDGRKDRPHDLIVWEDEQVMLFVPKAQTSQWELQVMTKGEVGNILEADTGTRTSLDRAILLAMKVLTAMGCRMINGIELSRRFNSPDNDQRLLYCFLPRLPDSPGAFSELQRRFIVGHFPEDFANACRRQVPDFLS